MTSKRKPSVSSIVANIYPHAMRYLDSYPNSGGCNALFCTILLTSNRNLGGVRYRS